MKKQSYAKINLALNVLNKTKPNKLHDLDMINLQINLKDNIYCKFILDDKNEIIIKTNNVNIPTNQKNLVYQVIEKFKKIHKLSFSCKVYIKKVIPVEAGLGGGSSNAATMLKMLDCKFKTNMSVLQQMRFLEDITSDGPYFVINKAARVKGSGNIISPIKNNLKAKVLLIKPFSGCSSKAIYSSLDYKHLPRCNINKLCEGLKENNIETLSCCDNSLLNSASKNNNEINDIIKRLKACDFEVVSLSGSGSTCFAISKRAFPFKRAKELFKRENYELFKICSIKR